MKYLALVTALFMLSGKVFAGDVRSTPAGGESNPIPADYGGVEIATNAFYVGLATVPHAVGPRGISYADFYISTTNVNGVPAQSRWLVYGVVFGSGSCQANDFISVQVSTAGADRAREITRFYNSVNIASSSVAGCGGVVTTRWPFRAYGNLFWGLNKQLGSEQANPYTRADLLYYKEP